MKKSTCLSALLLLVLVALSIQAKPFMWWNEPGPEPVEQPSEAMAATTGDCKTLIIVSKFPEDTAISSEYAGSISLRLNLILRFAKQRQVDWVYPVPRIDPCLDVSVNCVR